MAQLSSSNSLTQHLADRGLAPIISTSNVPSPSNPTPSSRSQAQLQALSSLTSTAVVVFEFASRLGLGVPQRIMIESPSGPVILHSFLNPQLQRLHSRHARQLANERGIIEQAREELRPFSGSTESESILDGREDRAGLMNGVLNGGSGDEEDLNGIEGASTVQQPPMLIASVIAPSAAELGNARRAAARLESTGREIQREWVREQEGPPQIVSHGGDG